MSLGFIDGAAWIKVDRGLKMSIQTHLVLASGTQPLQFFIMIEVKESWDMVVKLVPLAIKLLDSISASVNFLSCEPTIPDAMKIKWTVTAR